MDAFERLNVELTIEKNNLDLERISEHEKN